MCNHLTACRLSFVEFHDHMWLTLNEWENPDTEHVVEDPTAARARFALLDANKCAAVAILCNLQS